MIEAHAHLADDQDNAGLRTTGFGDVCPRGKNAQDTSTAMGLRVVGE